MSLNDEQVQVEKSIKQAFIVSIIITVIVSFNILKMIDIEKVHNLWALIFIIFLIILSIGIKRKSRICIVLLTLYYFLIQLFSFLQNYKYNPLNIISIIFIYFLIKGIVASFKYHSTNVKWYDKKDPAYKRKRIIGAAVCCAISIVLISHFIIVNYIGYGNLF